MSSFIQRQAELYQHGMYAHISGTDRVTWKAYRDEIDQQWFLGPGTRGVHIENSDSANTYLTRQELARDIQERKLIKTWRGGRFGPDHPLANARMVSRALHDYVSHYTRQFSFAPKDELEAAWFARKDFSALAQRAQWTDDVAMSCYFVHYGKFPDIQYPLIVEPDWNGLREYLDSL